jgi:xanthine dehydrogenase FAD-binding subunit
MLLDVVKVEIPTGLPELWRAHDNLSGARVLLAGGTDLLVQGKDGKVPRGTWIDLRRVAEFHGIDRRDGYVRLGSLATYGQALRSPLLAGAFQAVVEGAREVGSPQIRSKGTYAGNCANASPAGDGIPGLYAHDARIVLMKVGGGTREVPIEDFFLGVRKTVLAADEVISEIRLPVAPARRSTFVKLGTREAMAIAKVSVAAAARLDGGTLRDVRIALGAAAPTVVRARETERLLEGQPLSDALLADAAKLVQTECRPIDDYRSNAVYRRAMIGVCLRRAVSALAA